MSNFWRLVNKVIRDADLLLLLLDSRLVDETRNREIEMKVRRENKVLIYVITKCDLADQKEMERCKKTMDPCVFVSATKHLGTTMLRNRILIEAKRKGLDNKRISVGVLGYPNVGKSSLINAMKGKHSAPTSSMSGFTKSIQKVRGDARIVFLDTPGVIPYQEKDPIKHAMIGSVDHNNAKEPDLVVFGLMDLYPSRVEAFYGVPVSDDKEETIERIGEVRQLCKRGGVIDVERTARMILKDWQKGLIK